MAEGSVFKKQTKQDRLRKWILNQGRSVWEKNTFRKVPDPKEMLVKGFEEYIDTHKFSIHKESKISVYVWGSWLAISDLMEDLAELKQEKQDMENDLKSQLKICSQEWADHVEKLRQEKDSFRQQLEALKASVAAEKSSLLEELQFVKQNSVAEKVHLSGVIQDLRVQLSESQEARQNAEQQQFLLQKQLEDANITSKFLINQAKNDLKQISHVNCENKIKGLEKQLRLQTGVVAAIRATNPTEAEAQALLSSFRREQEAAASQCEPIASVCQKGPSLATSGNQSNIALIKTKQVARVTDDGSVQKERILESRVFKPSELLSISKQLGELNKSTALSWIAKVWKRFDSLTGQDLTELARACLRPEDLATFEMEMDSVSDDETDMKEWMLALLAVFFPGKSISRLFSNEVQSPHEYPEAYLQRKLVLGMLSGDSPEEEEQERQEEEDEFDEEKHSAFIESLLEGLLPEIRLAMVPFDCKGIRYQEFVSTVRKVARIMRESGQSNVKKRERVQKEPIDTIQMASQATPRRFQSANGRQQQSFGQGRQIQQSQYQQSAGGRQFQSPQLQQAEQGRVNQSFPQSQYQQPALQLQRQEQSLRNQIWNTLKQAGFDMKEFDKKPDNVLLEALMNWKQGIGAACAQSLLPVANGLFLPSTQFPVNGALAPSAPPLQ